ncbi:hypothetical protein F2Q68_00046033 [Brassica cretica]|uniref:Uncharacterized protein n=1 Tax=Brassica cretica TaxID=69181 RepID=A0A8S9LL77_BRACR|nr:hypothetical protein F2Q68_00046033 [Brassica cretica]
MRSERGGKCVCVGKQEVLQYMQATCMHFSHAAGHLYVVVSSCMRLRHAASHVEHEVSPHMRPEPCKGTHGLPHGLEISSSGDQFKTSLDVGLLEKVDKGFGSQKSGSRYLEVGSWQVTGSN